MSKFKLLLGCLISVLFLPAVLFAQIICITCGGNGDSDHPSISEDGRFIAFDSEATNLPGAASADIQLDIFIYDRDEQFTPQIRLISQDNLGFEVSSFPSLIPSISKDGSIIAFTSYAQFLPTYNNSPEANILYRSSNDATSITQASVVTGGATGGNEVSHFASISGDGRYIAFRSNSTNLAEDANLTEDIFRHDTQSRETILISKATAGDPGNNTSSNPSISYDGRFIVFESYATNFVPGATGGISRIYIRDTQNNTTEIISGVSANSNSIKPDINSNSDSNSSNYDGRFVVFQSQSTNLLPEDTDPEWDIYLFDRQTSSLSLVSKSSSGVKFYRSYSPSISGDGRYLAFFGKETLLTYFEQIYLHDTYTGETANISKPLSGENANNQSFFPSISSDGHYVAFSSTASDLVADDNNSRSDIFLAENPFWQPEATPTPTPDPDATPTPTPTPTPTATATVTPSPSAIPSPTPTVPIEEIPVPVDGGTDRDIRRIVREDVNPVVKTDIPRESITGRDVEVSFNQYKIVDIEKSPLRSFSSVRIKKRKLRLRYKVKLNGTAGRKRIKKKRITKKNRVTFRRLKPGKYRVKYRVEVYQRKNTIAKTGYSPAREFSIN